MNANPSPQESEQLFELPCIELIMAMLGNAVEEIEQLCHPVPRLRHNSLCFGKIKSDFQQLRWFLTSPDGAELLTSAAGINGVLYRYRRLALPMLAKAERLAKETSDEAAGNSGRNHTVALISAPEKQVANRQGTQRENLHSSVDIIAISPTSPVAVILPDRDGKSTRDGQRRESHSSVDIIAPKQAELFPDFFTSTPVSL